MARTSRSRERGATLIFAMALILALAVLGVGLIRYAGSDRVESARKSSEARSLSCAEAGIQFGRRLFGCAYKTSNNWNDFLQHNAGVEPAGNRTERGGNIDGTSPGSDFVVSVQDDDDERPMGLADDPARDNNLTLILRSRCINPRFASLQGGQRVGEVVEVRMVYIPGLSDHGSAPSGSNAMEAAAGGDWVRVNVSDCPESGGSSF